MGVSCWTIGFNVSVGGHRCAVSIVVQMALGTGHFHQRVHSRSFLATAGQFLLHQFVKHGDRAIAVGTLGLVAKAQVGRHVGGAGDAHRGDFYDPTAAVDRVAVCANWPDSVDARRDILEPGQVVHLDGRGCN